MKVDFLEAAKSDLIQAVRYYNSERAGLGFEFAAEVQKTIKRIRQFPSAWTRMSKNTRRCLTNRFPYGVIYSEEEETILVISVMHTMRHPDSWKDRV